MKEEEEKEEVAGEEEEEQECGETCVGQQQPVSGGSAQLPPVAPGDCAPSWSRLLDL